MDEFHSSTHSFCFKLISRGQQSEREAQYSCVCVRAFVSVSVSVSVCVCVCVSESELSSGVISKVGVRLVGWWVGGCCSGHRVQQILQEEIRFRDVREQTWKRESGVTTPQDVSSPSQPYTGSPNLTWTS